MTSGRALYFFPANFPFWLLPKKGFSNPGLTTFDHEDNHLRPSLETIAIELPFQSFKNIICKIHFMAFYGNSVAQTAFLMRRLTKSGPDKWQGGVRALPLLALLDPTWPPMPSMGEAAGLQTTVSFLKAASSPFCVPRKEGLSKKIPPWDAVCCWGCLVS